MDSTAYLQQLKECELFKDLNDKELNELYASMQKMTIQPGEVLVSQGETSDCMYVLLSGRLLVSCDNGKIIGQIGRGQTVGEMGLITNELRSATVVAMRESVLLKLDQHRFSDLWSRHPSLLFEVTKIITQRLQKTLKERTRYNNESNILVLQANAQAGIDQFLIEIEQSFDLRFKYKIVRRSDFPSSLKDEASHRMIHELENQYDYLFYQISADQTEWRDFLMGYADRILVLANGLQPVNYDPDILAFLTGSGIHQQIKKMLVLLYDRSSSPLHTRSWLKPIPFSRHYHIQFNRREDFSRLLRLLNGTAIGLVLGGGGTRSWAQVGAMKYIFEQRIPIDAYAGTSAGSINAGTLAISRDYQDYFEYAERFAKELSFTEYTIPFCSLLSSKSISSALREIFGEMKMEDLKTMVFCVAADLLSSKEVDIYEGLLWLAVRASISLPGIYPPIFIDGKPQQLLVDGGVINNLPVDVLKNYFEGYGKIISIDISEPGMQPTPYDYPIELTWQTILKQKIFTRSRKLVIPSIMNTFMQGLMLSSDQKTMLNAMQSDIRIKPNLTGFKLLDQSRKEELLELGYTAARQALENWQIELDVFQ